MKVNREVLNQFIYDLGYSKALEFWKLSDLQAKNILNYRLVNRKPEPFTEPKETPVKKVDASKAETIWRVINANYSYLRKDYIRGSDTSKINVRSETPEDKFHNSLIKLIESLGQFEYISEEKTLEYIRSRLFFEKKGQQTTEYRLNKRVVFINDSETTINNIPDENN